VKSIKNETAKIGRNDNQQKRAASLVQALDNDEAVVQITDLLAAKVGPVISVNAI
jgi:hypothetical protein